MSHRYDKIFNKQEKPQVDEILNKPVEQAQEPVEANLSEETVSINKPVEAYVTGCEKLYLRSRAKKDSDSICILEKDEKVFITDFNASEDYYAVKTETGFEGFCMKKFIAMLAES